MTPLTRERIETMTEENQPPNTPEGVLVFMKNKLNIALGIDTRVMKLLIDRFVILNLGKGSSKTHFAKVNTYKELFSPKMTIKVFFKYLNIIRLKSIKITITATTINDREVTVSEVFPVMN